MATNTSVNGYKYYRITRVVGHIIENGKKKSIKKQFVGKSKAEAEAKFETYMNSQGKCIDPSRIFGDIAEEFNRSFENNSGYSISTRKLYLQSYKARFGDLGLGNIQVGNITYEHIEDAYNAIQCSRSALKTLNNYMKLLFKWCDKRGYCENVMSKVELPEKPAVTMAEDIEVYTDAEIRIIKERLHNHTMYPAIMFGLYAGLRASEVLGLRWSDIRDGKIFVTRQCYRGKIIPPKSKSKRVIPMHHCIKEALEDYPRKSNYIFVTDSGKFIDYSNFTRALRSAYARNDINQRRFHCYRHTFATNLCKQGVPIQVVAKLCGHNSISVTAEYYTLVDDAQIFFAIDQL